MKIQIYYTHFPSIFAGVVKSTAFCTVLLLFQKRLKHLCHIFASNCNSNMSTNWNSSSAVQIAVDLTTPAKNRRKMSMIDLNFLINKKKHGRQSGFQKLRSFGKQTASLKSHNPGLQDDLKLAFQITFTQPDFFVKCNCPNSYSVCSGSQFDYLTNF